MIVAFHPAAAIAALGLALGPAAPPPGRPLDPVTDAAESFAAGERAFARGEYDDAAAAFARAQQLAPHPHALYNLGTALELAGDLPGAWGSFRELEARGEPAALRDEARARAAALERRVAVLRVEAAPRERICLGTTPIPQRDGGFEIAAATGEHDLVVDDRHHRVRLVAGQTRAVAVAPDGAAPRSRGVTIAIGIAVGAAVLATGLGAGAVATPDGHAAQRTGLGVGASVSAAGAATAGVLALALPHARRPRAARTAPTCPPHPALRTPVRTARPRG